MKKLMFVAAVIGSAVAFGADLDNFLAGDGVYNVTFSEKAFAVGGTIYGEDIKSSACETKSEAQKEANDEFAMILDDPETYPDAKKKSTNTVYDSEEEGYVCTIKWTYTDESAVTEKLVTKSYAGILIKGSYNGQFVEDGAFWLWSKSKDGKYFGPSIRDIGSYEAYSVEDAVFAGVVNGKKSVGTVDLDGQGIYCGTAFGTSNDEGVKSLSGQINFCESDVAACGYGTWKIQKDATLTKMAAMNYPLSKLLAKKGAVEVEETAEEE